MRPQIDMIEKCVLSNMTCIVSELVIENQIQGNRALVENIKSQNCFHTFNFTVNKQKMYILQILNKKYEIVIVSFSLYIRINFYSNRNEKFLKIEGSLLTDLKLFKVV